MKVALKVPPGLVSDDTTFSTPGLWEDGSNVRFWRGKPQTIGGWSSALSSTLDGVCRAVLPWTNNSGVLNIAFGTHTKLYVLTGGELADITPTLLAAGAEHGAPGPGYGAGPYSGGAYGDPSTDFYPRTWSLVNYGETLLASPRGGTLYQWSNDPAVVAAEITQAPDRIESLLVTPQRQAIAFGCNEEVSGVYNPLCIRWCDLENLTDWTTSSNDNAGEYILDGGGRIVAARLIGSYIAVWTDNALYMMRFVGLPGQTFQIDRVGDNCGLLGPNAVAIINQIPYWIGPDYQFRRWAPGVPPEIIPCPIRLDFKDNMVPSQADKVCAMSLTQFGEIWWFYPDSRDGLENSRYVAVSTLDGAWFRGQMARSAVCDAGVAGYPLMIAPTGEAYYHEMGDNANGANLEWHLKSSDQYIGGADQFLMIQGVWPDFENQRGAVSLTLYLRKYPQAEAVEKGPYTLLPSASKKDFRVSGRVVATKWSGASNPSFARFGKPQFEAVPTGRQ